jgi:mono/diheme cytochrome c family protein
MTYVLTTAEFVLCLLMAGEATGDADTAPRVAGYERFFAALPESADNLQRGGRLLLRELSCTACHVPDADVADSLAPKRGPVLDGAGVRYRRTWLRRFLAHPPSVKRGTTMPAMFAGLESAQRDEQVTALVEFLLSLRQPLYPPLPITKDDDPLASSFQRGYELYHRVGCVACHDPDRGHPLAAAVKTLGDEDDDDGRVRERPTTTDIAPPVPLEALGDKYDHVLLTTFLLDPLRLRPAGRMPDLKLNLLEAADIAHYLLGERIAATSDLPPLQSELVQRGRTLFQTRGCVQCHAADGLTAGRTAPSLAELSNRSSHGCLSAPPTRKKPGLPDFALNAQQHRSLAAALKAPRLTAPVDAVAAAEIRVHETLMRLNCYACHQRQLREGSPLGGVGLQRWEFFVTQGQVDFGDEGRIPPPLTGVGGKLTETWMRNVLVGKGDLRPHLAARMPKFGLPNIEHLPAALIAADLQPRRGEDDVFPVAGDRAAGRELLDQGCIQCHALNGQTMVGVVGIDLANLGQRLQPQWFRDFLLDPGAVKPRTRMPTFYPRGISSIRTILDGDTDRQIAALWAYLKDTSETDLPAKLAAGQQQTFELVPKEEPVLFRTFMKTAGTHAVAVGFPAGVHFAWDAQRVRLSDVWRGRFIDAHGTWFNRFAPPAEPLSADRVTLTAEREWAVLPSSDADWPVDVHEGDEPAGRQAAVWRGYRLDKARVPTFLYSVDGVDFEDRMQPTADGHGLQRRVRCSGDVRDVYWRIPTLAKTEPMDGDGPSLRITIVAPRIEQLPTGNHARIAIPFSAGHGTLQVEYRW